MIMEMVEKQKRIIKFKAAGDKNYKEDGRLAEMTVDRVLRARDKMKKKTMGRRWSKSSRKGKLRNYEVLPILLHGTRAPVLKTIWYS